MVMQDEEDDVEMYHVIKAQALVRRFIVRARVMKGIAGRYEKVYDPKRRRYYYYDKVKDKSSWVKPACLLDRELPAAATYSPDQAAAKVQRAARKMLALLKVRLLFQQAVMRVSDEASGKEYFYNPLTQSTMWDLPAFMGNKLDHARRDIPPTREGAAQAIVSDDESDNSSADSETRRERRRRRRKFPRSKAQELVDFAEDNHASATELDLSHLGARHITSRIFDLANLKQLNLSNNKLHRLSPDVQYLSQLTSLDLRHNRLTAIPLELRELRQLRELLVGHNQIHTFSGHIYKLEELQRLDLSFNEFTDLPLETGNLELLQELGTFEVGISRLQNLLFLDISHCRLDGWPSQTQQLAALRELYLSHNAIELVPDDVSDLTNLQILHLDYNVLSALPSVLYHMPLKELVCHHNQLTALPGAEPSPQSQEAGFALTKSLQFLDISHNRLRVLDANLSHCQMLKVLLAMHNDLVSMSADCFQGLTKLQTLDLSHNQLAELSASMGSAGHLETITLDYNLLTEVPSPLLRCTKVKRLTAAHNKISNINGKVLTMFTQLEHLELQHNEIAVLANLLWTIKRLVYVDLSNNRIAELPDGIGAWTALQYLDCSFNRIPDIPVSLLYHKELHTLFLHRNTITTVPVEIVNLVSLRRITLHHNQLESSPQLLLSMPQLRSCDLSANPIKSFFYQWQMQHSQHADNAESVLSKQLIYKRITLLAEKVERDASALHFCTPKAKAKRQGALDNAACVTALCQKLYAMATGDSAAARAYVDVGYSTLLEVLEDPEPVPTAEVLQAVAQIFSAIHKMRDASEWKTTQRMAMRWMNKSERWGHRLLPPAAEVAELMQRVNEGGLALVLNALPLGVEVLDNVAECCDALEHLHQHLVVSEMQAMLRQARNPSMLLEGAHFDEEVIVHGADRSFDDLQTSSKTRMLEGSKRLSSRQTKRQSAKLASKLSSSKQAATTKETAQLQPDKKAGTRSSGMFAMFGRKSAQEEEERQAHEVAERAHAEMQARALRISQTPISEMCAVARGALVARNANPWFQLRSRDLLPEPADSTFAAAAGRGRLLSMPLPCLVTPSHISASSFTCQTSDRDDAYLWLHFDALLVLIKAAVLHAQHLQRSVRWVERCVDDTFSALDVPQRSSFVLDPQQDATGAADGAAEMVADYEDLLADVYTELTGEMKESEKQRRAQQSTLGSRLAELKETYYAALATALPPEPEEQEEAGEPEEPAPGALTRQSSSVSVQSTDSAGAPRTESALTFDKPAYTDHLKKLFAKLEKGQPAAAQRDAKGWAAGGKDVARFLLLYRQLLLLWALRCVEKALSLLQCQGFDVTFDECLDETLPLDEEGGRPIRQREQEAVLRLRRQGRRCVYYRAIVCQCLGIYVESAKSYRMYFRLTNRVQGGSEGRTQRVAKDTLLDYAKVLLALGQYPLAVEMMEKVVRDYIMPVHGHKRPALKRRNPETGEMVAEVSSGLMTPIEIMPLDAEVAVLYKFALNQVLELAKANVMSAAQRRMFNVQTSGFVGSRTNWPPAEYARGRSARFVAEVAQQAQREQDERAVQMLATTRAEVRYTADALHRQADEMLLRVRTLLQR